jgi:hypothetical protein
MLRSCLPPATSAEDVIAQPARAQFEVFIDQHRRALSSCLNGLTEEQARRALVRSRVTLLAWSSTRRSSRRSGSMRPTHAARVPRSAFPRLLTSRSSFTTTTTLPPSSGRTARHASHNSARGHPWGWMTWSTGTGAAPSHCAGCTCTCYASWPSTAGTQTSCENNSPATRATGPLTPYQVLRPANRRAYNRTIGT